MVAFNLGSLGFLTNCQFEDHRSDLHAMIYGSQKLDTCSITFDSMDEGANTLGEWLQVWVGVQVKDPFLCVP